MDVCRIGHVCCLSAPAHQPFPSNSLDLSAPEEAYIRNVRASGTLKFGYEGVFKIYHMLLFETSISSESIEGVSHRALSLVPCCFLCTLMISQQALILK